MSNNKDFKVKNGIQPTSYFEGVGTVVSGSVGYSLSDAVYDSVSFSVASQETSPNGLVFNTDGTKLYVVGQNNDGVFQYSLSTAFDISTASYDSVSLNVLSQDTFAQDLTFNSDGTKLYVIGAENDSIYQYSLSTAFDLSTASYDSVSFSVASEDTTPRGLAFNNNGTKMYIVGGTGDAIDQYSLSVAFDLSTASYDSVTFSVATQGTNPKGLVFNSDGTKLFVVDAANDTVFQYSLSTGFDLSTAVYSNISFSVISQSGDPEGVVFNTDGTKMYVIDSTTDIIYQYSTALNTASLDLSTGSVFDYTPTSDVQVTLSNPAASGTSSGATLLISGNTSGGYDLGNASYDSVSLSVASQDGDVSGLFIKPDGTKLYINGQVNDRVYQYSLSTAWDLSSATYDNVSFSVSAQDANPLNLTFKSDGTKFYILGGTNSRIYQYSLSTAWDLSTASYESVAFDPTAQGATPRGIDFKDDGTKFYVGLASNDTIYQYGLTTAWDLSTASYDSVSFYPSDAMATGFPAGIRFADSGSVLLISNGGTVFKYTLGTAYNLSTATFVSGSLDLTQEDGDPKGGIFVKTDGSKFYATGGTNDSVYQYTTLTPATITYDPNLQWSAGTAPTAPALGETDVITFNTTDGGTTYTAVQAIDGAA